MALKHHPDKNPNNPEATEKVSYIYHSRYCSVGGVINENRVRHLQYQTHPQRPGAVSGGEEKSIWAKKKSA